MGPDILGEDGTFAAAGSADYCEITAAVGVQKVGYRRKNKLAPCKNSRFFLAGVAEIPLGKNR
jgi:hypothetical protein